MIMSKITKDTIIGEVVQNYPKSVDILSKHGMHCIGCHVATWETLEQAAQSHGINISKLMEDLNKEVKNK